ncbi:hypothetical protein EHS25_002756 [Saitozyma podzolica]|uniref:PB1 domain-containing protein n=1 Tax=Saitozyma podzolica TaxID=1890683 RepID=A0A427YD90_9TREE|nr:hypothetical protein EHS25_002756 [Saitozyma podzolica]
MSLKAELSTWATALKAYDAQDFPASLAEFGRIADTSKINWNIGIIHATLGEHQSAVEWFARAVAMDGFLTVGYMQMGVSNFMLGQYTAALKDFDDALLYMRGNQTINYEQLGLSFQLHSAEILFNCGLAKIYLGQVDAGLADLSEAAGQKVLPEHGVIDDAIRDRGADYNVFSVPVGVLFKPAPGKLKNLEARDYMGKAVLVAASDASETYTTFTGLTRLQRGQTPTGAPLDASHPLNRSATLSTSRQADQNPSRLSRSNTFAATSSLTPLRPVMSSASPASASVSTSSPASGFTERALPGRPTPARALTTSMTQSVRESIPMSNEPPTLPLKLDTIKSTGCPSAKAYGGGGFGAASPPTEILRTPDERVDGGRGRSLRVTELYDDYYKSAGAYDEDIPELPPIGGKKIEAWAKKTAAAGPPSSFPPSYTSSPPESSGKGGLGLTRGPSNASRRGFGLARSESRVGTNAESRYDDDGSDAGSFYDMVKIRVKVHVGETTRGMSILPTDSHATFVTALSSKFPQLAARSSTGNVSVRFRDEDGDMVSLVDEGDFEAAVDVARVMAKGRAEGKLELWVD